MTTRPHADIFAEPAEVDPDTLRNLGPLRRMAGIWEGARGDDVHPVREGARRQAFVERFELQPIDPQTNGPQAALWAALRHPRRPPGGDADLPPPGRLLPVGAGDGDG
ncbi:hypothetical protein [Dankookia sp. P2]|uniref:hypothetical protein n=1 Tax=Dankookia sp. P2 TaxID=3423955 RepID=UPI003D66694B